MKNTKEKYNYKDVLKLELPKAKELELAVIGAMLIDSSVIDDVMMILKSEEVFYEKKHRSIFLAIKELTLKNVSVDMLTVANKLKEFGELDAVGGDLYLVQLTQKVSSSANVEHHSRILLQQWVRRTIIALSQKQVAMGYAETRDIFELIETSEKDLDVINEMLDTGKKTISFSDAIVEVIQRVELLSNKKENEVVGVTTGFKKLDDFTGGWQNSDLVIIAARPGMGKTAFILKNILEIALLGNTVGMFSLEMSIQQLAARLIAINSDFHLSQLIKKGFEHVRYFEKLQLVGGQMTSLPILIDDNTGISIQQLYMKARMWKRKYDIKALFVDYIQLMGDEDKNKNREQEIAIISRKLKIIAKELDIPVIALSQLSRGVETRGGDKRPRLSDLRESGAIEQDADIVSFIYRPEYYGFEPDDELKALGANTEFIFAKYRTGSLETKGLWWQGDKTKFMDPEFNYNDNPY